MLVAVELEFRKGSSVTLDRLTNTTLAAVQLDVALDFESRGVGRVAGDANQDQPLFVCSRTVVDNLRANKSGMAIEDFLRRGSRVGD